MYQIMCYQIHLQFNAPQFWKQWNPFKRNCWQLGLLITPLIKCPELMAIALIQNAELWQQTKSPIQAMHPCLYFHHPRQWQMLLSQAFLIHLLMMESLHYNCHPFRSLEKTNPARKIIQKLIFQWSHTNLVFSKGVACLKSNTWGCFSWKWGPDPPPLLPNLDRG